MTMTEPAVTGPLADARNAVQTTDQFALGFLMLCDMSYTAGGSGTNAVKDIQTIFTNHQAPTYASTPGQWVLEWGPFTDANNSNLMYVASYRLGDVTGPPVFVAVAIRGTDIAAIGKGALLEQLREDLRDGTQVAWPYANPHNPDNAAAISQGTMLGLNVLQALPGSLTQPSSQNVAAFLTGYLARYPEVPVVVTGHSLGGCQTTVMAAWLASQLPAGTAIVPHSFAAPTAGNAAFIAMYQATFPYCPRWYNPIDLVPMAYDNVQGIYALWNQCNHPCPEYARLILDDIRGKTNGKGYTQQPASSSRELAAGCADETFFQKLLDPWLEELVWQHFPRTAYWCQVAASEGVDAMKWAGALPPKPAPQPVNCRNGLPVPPVKPF